MTNSHQQWARDDVARAQFGDPRRLRRAAVILGDLARHATGTITGSIRRVAKREAAYRFVENLRIAAKALVRSAALACFDRLRTGLPFFLVPLDFCFLTLPGAGRAVTGPIGDRHASSRGLVAMTGLALTPGGTPLGLCFQELFPRSEKRRPRGPCRRCRARWKHRKRGGRAPRASCTHRQEARIALPLAQKETRFWIQAMDFVVARVAEAKVKARPWFQCDRGADFWDLLAWASDHATQAWVTVRCNCDRTLDTERRVRQELRQCPVLGRKEVEIPALGSRQARTAQVEIRAAPVVVTYARRSSRAPLGVVWVHEVGPVPKGQARLDWALWTTHPIRTLAAIRAVVVGYEHRWMIEEFHKTWKSVCGVEKTQLRSLHALQVWATLLAMASARIQRLLKRARENPTDPATTELSELELKALLLHSPRLRNSKSTPTLAAAVEAIAIMGGYTGKSSGGPPGPITLGRGLDDLRVATETIDFLIRMGHLDL